MPEVVLAETGDESELSVNGGTGNVGAVNKGGHVAIPGCCCTMGITMSPKLG
jgi:hypothetical protein